MKSLQITALTILIAHALGGCAGSRPTSDTAGLDRAETSVRTSPQSGPRTESRDSIAMLVGQDALTWSQIRPFMAEGAGPVLEEIVLDHMLHVQAAAAGISVSASEIGDEEKRLTARLSTATNADSAASGELLTRLRSGRGLGPRRYQALLERNALLRKMVASEVSVTPEQLQQAREVRYGPKYKGRVLIMQTEREASAARAQIAGSNDQRGALASLASVSSTTNQLYPAGVVEPISAADPTYPSALRSVVSKMKPGELSPVIALDRTFAIFLLEEIVPGTAAPAEDRGLETDVRAANERMAMDRKAQQLLSVAGANVLDPDLRWAWERRQDR